MKFVTILLQVGIAAAAARPPTPLYARQPDVVENAQRALNTPGPCTPAYYDCQNNALFVCTAQGSWTFTSDCNDTPGNCCVLYDGGARGFCIPC